MIKRVLLLLITITTLQGTQLKGIVLLSPEVKPHRIASSWGVLTEGFEFPKLSRELERKISWGADINKELIVDIQKEIIRTYQKLGRPIVLVEIPPQDLSTGIIQYQIIEGRLGDIEVSGNCWF